MWFRLRKVNWPFNSAKADKRYSSNILKIGSDNSNGGTTPRRERRRVVVVVAAAERESDREERERVGDEMRECEVVRLEQP